MSRMALILFPTLLLSLSACGEPLSSAASASPTVSAPTAVQSAGVIGSSDLALQAAETAPQPAAALLALTDPGATAQFPDALQGDCSGMGNVTLASPVESQSDAAVATDKAKHGPMGADGHGGPVNPLNGNDANRVGNPNEVLSAACAADMNTLKADEATLKASPEWAAVMASATFTAVKADMAKLKTDDCKRSATPSAVCEADGKQLHTDLQAFWKSPELTALFASKPMAAVKVDAKAIHTDGCFAHR